MRTLVIHPDDRSTDFLKGIYQNLPGTTLITSGCNQDQVHDFILQHDRIMMLGHGSSYGLLSVDQFDNDLGYIIDDKSVPFLSGKKKIFIWCHADEFVNRNNLNGFYTGMFISEVAEASIYDIAASQDEIDYSNKLFADAVNKQLDEVDILNRVLSEYTTNYNPVIEYNRARLYHNEYAAVNRFDEFEKLLKRAS